VGIRETLNEKRGITIGAVSGVIVLAIVYIIYSVSGGPGGGGGVAVQKSWYTSDDGNTYFSDDPNPTPPFSKNGKDAVRCYVFKCSDGKAFVGYLERFDAQTKAKRDEMLKTKNFESLTSEDLETGREVKKPKTGEQGWVKAIDPKGHAVMEVKCPDGKPPVMVPAE